MALAAKADKKGSPLTEKELQRKITIEYRRFTKAEILQDTILEVKSYVIAHSKGSYHKLSADDALRRLQDVFNALGHKESPESVESRPEEAL